MRLLPMILFAIACTPSLYSSGEPYSACAVDFDPANNVWGGEMPEGDLGGEGYNEGDIVPEFCLQDQNGDTVSLWQFHGDWILLDLSTMWCPPCRLLAEHVQDTVEDYDAYGFTYITVLQQNMDGQLPDTEELNQWADSYGIVDGPVLAESEDELTLEGTKDGLLPGVFIINRKMRVARQINVGQNPDNKVRDALDDVLH